MLILPPFAWPLSIRPPALPKFCHLIFLVKSPFAPVFALHVGRATRPARANFTKKRLRSRTAIPDLSPQARCSSLVSAKSSPPREQGRRHPRSTSRNPKPSRSSSTSTKRTKAPESCFHNAIVQSMSPKSQHWSESQTLHLVLPTWIQHR